MVTLRNLVTVVIGSRSVTKALVRTLEGRWGAVCAVVPRRHSPPPFLQRVTASRDTSALRASPVYTGQPTVVLIKITPGQGAVIAESAWWAAESLVPHGAKRTPRTRFPEGHSFE
ncbi:hypothetical protein JCM9534A_51640 [Catenuloplanes indicus JCM 9534]